MNHYLIFLFGMLTGAFFGIFVLGLCQMARDDYFNKPEDAINPPTMQDSNIDILSMDKRRVINTLHERGC